MRRVDASNAGPPRARAAPVPWAFVSAAAVTESAPLVRHPQDRRALVIMTVAHGIQHFYVAGLAVTYPFVVSQFHVSYAVLGVVLTVAGLIGGLLQGAAGLVRGMSARLILALQNLGMALAALLGALGPTFAFFGGARVLGAAVSWPQHPVGSAYLAERFPHRRATVLSWHTAGGSIGTVTVPLLAAAIISAFGWRWALAVLAAVLVVGALLVGFGLPAEEGAVRPDPAAAGEPTLGLRQILGRRRVVAVLVASTIAAGGRGLGTLSAYVPAYLHSGLHLSALGVGALFTVIMAASVAGPVVAGTLADRIGHTRTLVATYVLGAGALLGFGLVGRHLIWLVVLGLCVGVLAYTESPLLQSLFADFVGPGAARSAFGAFFAIAYGVGSLWTALLGWVITVAGFPAAFAVMAGSFLVAGLVIAVGVPDRRATRAPAQEPGGAG